MKLYLPTVVASITSGAMLSLLGITGATFAWYTFQEFASADKISLTVEEGAPVQIGFMDQDDALVFPEVISQNNLIQLDPNYGNPHSLADVSSMFSSMWLESENEQKKPVLRESYKRSNQNGATEPAQEGFYQFEFYFACAEECSLYLSPETNVQPSTEDDGVLDSARISFYSKDAYQIAELSPDPHRPTYLGGPLDLRSPAGYYDYSASKEIAYGELLSEPCYQEPSFADLVETNAQFFQATHKAGVERLDLEHTEFALEPSKPIHELFFDEEAAHNSSCLGRIYPDHPLRLVITVYLEGWDLDALDHT